MVTPRDLQVAICMIEMALDGVNRIYEHVGNLPIEEIKSIIISDPEIESKITYYLKEYL